MKKLGEQWIENGRMYKAVVGANCSGCCYNGGNQGCYISGQGCPTYNSETDLVVRDLGILKDGLLQCPFCGEYPNLENNRYFWYCCTNDDCLAEVGTGKTKREAIDAWNRRA